MAEHTETHTERNQRNLEPFFANQVTMATQLVSLLYPLEAFVAEERRLGALLPKGAYVDEDFEAAILKEKAAAFAKSRTGSALVEGDSPMLDKASLQWLVFRVTALRTAAEKSEAAFLKQSRTFVDDFLTGCSYAVVLRVADFIVPKPMKNCPLSAQDQLKARREVTSLMHENESYRTALVHDNMALVGECVKRARGDFAFKLSMEDLMAAGVVGLMEGINRYHPGYSSKTSENGAAFAGSAAGWIRHYISREFQYYGHTISQPVTHQATMTDIRKLQKRTPTITRFEIAAELLAKRLCKEDPKFAIAFKKDSKAATSTPEFVAKAKAFADGHIKDAMELPTADAVSDFTLTSLTGDAVDFAASEKRRAKDIVGGIIARLPAGHQLALALTFGLSDSKEIGRRYLEGVVASAGASVTSLVSQRPSKPLARVVVGDAAAHRTNESGSDE